MVGRQVTELNITIPQDVDYADLKMRRDKDTGMVTFDHNVIRGIWASSGVDP